MAAKKNGNSVPKQCDFGASSVSLRKKRRGLESSRVDYGPWGAAGRVSYVNVGWSHKVPVSSCVKWRLPVDKDNSWDVCTIMHTLAENLA